MVHLNYTLLVSLAYLLLLYNVMFTSPPPSQKKGEKIVVWGVTENQKMGAVSVQVGGGGKHKHTNRMEIWVSVEAPLLRG